MTLKYMDEFRDAEIAAPLIEKIKLTSKRKIRLMEVCGTHTMSIFRSGIRSLLPATIRLISGPGCPVCVTAQGEIDAFIATSQFENVIIATFGDLMRVPGTHSSLQKERANGRDIRVVYSTMDALDIARKNPDKKVVFLGVGFETTAPTIAASIVSAQQMQIQNYSVLSAHKLVPPALTALMQSETVQIDGFILPGHVSVIIGLEAYRSFFNRYPIPSVVSGFEPADILQAITLLIEQFQTGRPQLANAYPRTVTAAGNIKAQRMMQDVFEIVDAKWRGIGIIPQSGYRIKEKYAAFDAQKIFQVQIPQVEDPQGCACGQILTGVKTPPQCPLYKTVCTPVDPVGPCMVSSEGTCAAYYRYHSAS